MDFVFYKLIPFPGFLPDFYANYLALFRSWVSEGKLEKFGPQAATPNQLMSLSSPSALSGSGILGFLGGILGFNVGPPRLPDIDLRGGMKVPHIHLDGNIYLLNEQQWREFSQKVVTDFQKRLDAVKAIPLSVDQVSSIAAAKSTLGG
jgi:hypothetical protein